MISAGMKWMRRAAVPAAMAALALAAADAPAQEQVMVKRAAELRDAPGGQGRTLASLPVQTPVTRLGERQGPWIRVSAGPAPGTTGWLHMFDVGAANAPAAGGNVATGALRGLTSFFNKGSAQAPAQALTTSTVGIRGLGAEDIASAQPNPAAVGRAEALRMDAGGARQFAMDAALSSQPVEPLPVPAAPAPASTSTPNNFNQGNTP